jgi:hypothetical protein
MRFSHNRLRTALLPSVLKAEPGSAAIRKLVDSGRPAMIARFGSSEIKATLFPKLPSWLGHFVEHRVFSDMAIASGFFPPDRPSIERFSKLMYEDMKDLDILGSWRLEERLLKRQTSKVVRVELAAMEPYLCADPWSEALEGKRVLVVHPFTNSIKAQYHNHRETLFHDRRVLPLFAKLTTIQAVQTLAGNKVEFNDWFAALDHMKRAMNTSDYDVAIIGCGAYGFPLAAHAKRAGKVAVHLGGATQILFGIKGRRWDEHPIISKFYNDSWVRPASEDMIEGAERVENACYW